MGRLKHVDPAYPLPTTPAYTYAYEANSAALVATVTGPVHTVTNTWESTRDALDTKKNADTAGTPSVPSSFNYSVNNLGQRDLVGPMMDGGSPAAPISIHSVAWEWAYNDRGELESADHGDDGTANTKDRFYAFDAIGNRDYVREGVFTDSSGTQVQYTANAPNQYTVANGVTLPTPAFDADGNNTNGPIPVATGNATLEWDAENRLVKVTRADSVVITYAYDYHGRRISKTVGGGTARHYFYEGWNPVAEYAGHTLDKTYLWGMDLSGSIQGAGGVGGLLAVKEGAYHYYPTFDGNGNVGEYLDAAGVSAAHYEYDAFGNTVASSGTKQSDFAHRFSTKFFDSESGFYYYGYRYYDPVTGRWPSRDPIEERGGTNLYGFNGNDALSRWDYLGQEVSPSAGGRLGLWGIAAWLLYYNVEIRVTCSKCECEMMMYEILKNAGTIAKLRLLRNEADRDKDGDGLVNLGDSFVVTGVAGGVGIVPEIESQNFVDTENCTKEEKIEALKEIRGDFEMEANASAVNEGLARIATGKLDNQGEMPNSKARTFLDAMIDRQEDLQESLIQEFAHECYDK